MISILSEAEESRNLISALIHFFTDQGISKGLAIAYLVVLGLVLVMGIICLIMWIRVCGKYYKNNKVAISTGRSSFDVAREALNRCGLQNIEVKRSGFIRAWIFGNSYSVLRKTIFLRRRIADKNSLTAVGIALQKVGVAKLCEGDMKAAKARYFLQLIGLFGPFLFLPIMLIGAVVDLILFQHYGTISIASLAVSGAILAVGFVATLLNIPVEKKANEMALEMIDESKVCTEEEKEQIAGILKAYLVAYICDFILTVLRILLFILEILMKVQGNRGGSSNN